MIFLERFSLFFNLFLLFLVSLCLAWGECPFLIFFQIILFLSQFLACNGCFGLLTKIKKLSGTSFWCTFSAWFFLSKCSLFNTQLAKYQLTKFQCHTFFPYQDIKENILLSSYLDNWWCHKLKDISSIILCSNDQQRKRRGEDGNTENLISREQKKLFRWDRFFW